MHIIPGAKTELGDGHVQMMCDGHVGIEQLMEIITEVQGQGQRRNTQQYDKQNQGRVPMLSITQSGRHDERRYESNAKILHPEPVFDCCQGGGGQFHAVAKTIKTDGQHQPAEPVRDRISMLTGCRDAQNQSD